MPDYGHPLEFGVFLPPQADAAGDTLTLARLADRLGLDLVSVQDHPYQAAFLDTWTTLSVIAASTTSVRVFPNVANLPLRPPAVLARSAASLDILSGGRVELGLGAGAFWDAIAGDGRPAARRRPSRSTRSRRPSTSSVHCGHPGAACGWTASTTGSRARIPARSPCTTSASGSAPSRSGCSSSPAGSADGWLPSSPYVPPEQLAGKNEIIDEAAEAAGRSTTDIRRLYNIAGTFTGSGTEFLRGPAKVWVEQLAELTLTEGISAFVLMVDRDGDDDLRRFAEEVAPGRA